MATRIYDGLEEYAAEHWKLPSSAVPPLPAELRGLLRDYLHVELRAQPDGRCVPCTERTRPGHLVVMVDPIFDSVFGGQHVRFRCSTTEATLGSLVEGVREWTSYSPRFRERLLYVESRRVIAFLEEYIRKVLIPALCLTRRHMAEGETYRTAIDLMLPLRDGTFLRYSYPVELRMGKKEYEILSVDKYIMAACEAYHGGELVHTVRVKCWTPAYLEEAVCHIVNYTIDGIRSTYPCPAYWAGEALWRELGITSELVERRHV